MADAIRISAESFRLIYKESFETWAQIHARVVEKPGFPPQAFVVKDVFQQCPALPRNLKLRIDQRGALATGNSIWNPNGTDCGHKLPSFRQPIHIRVAVKHPVLLSISEPSEAEMIHEQQTYISPWSIHLQQNPQFVLLHTTKDIDSLHLAATFSDAIQYLSRFCTRFGIMDQSHAALASVVLLPSMGGPKPIKLPTPRASRAGATHIPPDAPEDEPRHDWIYNDHHIDKLLTLSCNIRGIRPLLLSPFYEPSIECNAITPWLQGTQAAIKQVAENNSYMVGRMCMERSPKVAFLWIGCLILNLQDKILQGVRFGQIPVDLHSAAWSGTVQSFIQQRVSNPTVKDGYVSRANESRLLFLSQSDHHARVPVCQWRPFGETPIEDVDIEVRVHQQCEDHWLRYEGTGWECVNGGFVSKASQEADSQDVSDIPMTQDSKNTPRTTINYGELDQEREAISENATRSIFGWLRFNGFAQHEREIWEHEWFDIDEEDDEDDSGDEGTTGGSRMPPSHIKSWLSDVYPSVDDFSISL